MSIIYVTGHRNPDMDSICSAYAYAFLKNITDHRNKYVPVRLGSASRVVKSLFKRLDLPLPELLKDVKPKVREVIKHPRFTVREDDPVERALSYFAREKPTVLPVLEKGGGYKALLTSDDINAYFLRETGGSRERYHIVTENLPKVLRGSFLIEGDLKDFSAPVMVGAMEARQFKSRLRSLGEKPILVTGVRTEHVKTAIEDEVPLIILTGVDSKRALERFDFTPYKGTVFLSKHDTAETLRLLRLTSPVSDLLDAESRVPVIEEDMLFDEAKLMLMMSDFRGLSVFNEKTWKGFVTRRCFLDRPRQKIIMVDHNESAQSVIGIEDAEIVEIIDHHRLAPPRMKSPIYIVSEPLGSTCTIIYEQFKKLGLKPDKKRAEILLAGIMSDTVMLKSPTTTPYDRHVAEKLSVRAGIDDLQKFSEENIFNAGRSLSSEDPIKAIESDMKIYFESGVRFSISQIEVTSLEETLSLKDVFLGALERVRKKENFDWSMLLVTDVISDTSLLFTTGLEKEGRFFWEKKDDRVYVLSGVLSRKKQLLPEILRILEE